MSGKAEQVELTCPAERSSRASVLVGMNLKSAIKSVLPARFKDAVKRDLGVPSMEGSLLAMRACGFRPRVVLDIGAYRGEWMSLCRSVWPESSVLMVEGNPQRAEALHKRYSAEPGLAVECAILGAESKEDVPFYELDAASSVLPAAEETDHIRMSLPMRTLERVTRGSVFEKPDFIKLDIQGYELEVMKGGLSLLRNCEAVLIEVNLIPVYTGVPLLREVLDFLGDEGFRAYDIAGLIRRPRDLALWQADMVFVARNSPLISSDRYS
jgi:FkbM family methyltransferase